MTTYSKILAIAEARRDDEGVAHMLNVVKASELELRRLANDRPWAALVSALDGVEGYDIDPNSTYAEVAKEIDNKQQLLWGSVCILIIFLERLGETIKWEVYAQPSRQASRLTGTNS